MRPFMPAAARTLAAASVATLCLAASAQAGTVTLTEGDFGGWAATPVSGPAGGQTAEVTANGDPGVAWSVSTLTDAATATRHTGPGLAYDPSAGAVASISYSLDYNVTSAYGQGMGVFALVLLQGGSSYGVDAWFATGSGTGWRNANGSGLTETDFEAMDGGLGLDFSASGAPITFGFGTSNSGGSGITVRFDNFSAVVTTVSAVPLPAAAPLALAAFGALACLGRRRRA